MVSWYINILIFNIQDELDLLIMESVNKYYQMVLKVEYNIVRNMREKGIIKKEFPSLLEANDVPSH